MGLFSKTRTKRVTPPQRKFANAMLMRESMNRLAGREGRGDELQRQVRRSQAIQGADIGRRGLFRTLGARGMDSPGMFGRAGRQSSGGLASLIGAQTQHDVARRSQAIPMLNTLLAENQPYTKTRKKTGFMEKAGPYLKLAGSVGGSYGDMSKQAGQEAQTEFQSGGAKTQFGGTGGSSSVPQQTAPPASKTPGQTPVGGTSVPQQNVAQGGGAGGALTDPKKKKGGLSSIMGMMSMFGGGKGGGGGGMSMPAGGK